MNKKARIPGHIITLMILQALEHNMEYFEGVHDPATQSAIDWMCDALFTDRRHLVELLHTWFNVRSTPQKAHPINEILLECWTDNKKLKQATGRTRDEWLAIIE